LTSPLHSLTMKMWKLTYYMLQLGHDIQNSYWTLCRWRPYWIFAHKKVSPRVAEFGDFEHVFTCLNLSYGKKLLFCQFVLGHLTPLTDYLDQWPRLIYVYLTYLCYLGCGHLTVSADSEDSWKRFCLSRTRLRCLTLAFLPPDINTLT